MVEDLGFWSMKVGDLATWIGGIASALAAWAAWSAARNAMKIARMPFDAAVDEKIVRAQVLAPAFSKELREVQREAERVARDIQGVYATGHGNGREWLNGVRFSSMPATSRYREFIDCFPSAEASDVLRVIAELGVMDDKIAWPGQLDINNNAQDLPKQIQTRTFAVVEQAQKLGELARDTAVLIERHQVHA